MKQLDLFADAPERAWYEADVWEYHTGLPDRSGMARYTVLIRAPWDPPRRPREVRQAAMGHEAAAVEWRTWRKASAEQWCERIVAHLADGEPRTLNRIAVELVDATADVVGATAQAGLWLAVERGLAWWTACAPVHFIHRSAVTPCACADCVRAAA
jgi:hypothetical protein